jgi:hypothetical protein
MSLLAEFKGCQKVAFESGIGSDSFSDASDRMDVLWIQLSETEMAETQAYERQLWIDSGKAHG